MLVNAGTNPVNTLCHKPVRSHLAYTEDGVVDSLKYLIHHENYIKPWSHEFILTTFLTKAF